MELTGAGKDDGVEGGLVATILLDDEIPDRAALTGVGQVDEPELVPAPLAEHLGRELADVVGRGHDEDGCGFVLSGYAAVQNNQNDEVLEADLYIDNNLVETIKMPTSSLVRKHDIAWKYDLPEGKHFIQLTPKRIPADYHIAVRDLIVYSSEDPGRHTY